MANHKLPALAEPYVPPPPNNSDRFDNDPYAPLAKLAAEISVKPLTHLKERFRILSYGDMIELATGIGADPAKIWEWANK